MGREAPGAATRGRGKPKVSRIAKDDLVTMDVGETQELGLRGNYRCAKHQQCGKSKAEDFYSRE